ncbi:hypothetical protein HZA38_05935 [Candidatus Peregrinibacteria bacterium]|nr:hypothetical protein [Candidatus Peregrinibacteria bacterium]
MKKNHHGIFFIIGISLMLLALSACELPYKNEVQQKIDDAREKGEEIKGKTLETFDSIQNDLKNTKEDAEKTLNQVQEKVDDINNAAKAINKVFGEDDKKDPKSSPPPPQP